MTAVINVDKGLTITLPQWRDEPVDHPVPERNLFKIQLNSNNEIMVEGERVPTLTGLRDKVRSFILNNGVDPKSSADSEHAIVSLKADRGTTQSTFISALDEIQAAYYSIYSERVGLTMEQFRNLDIHNSEDRLIIEKAKTGIPMNISLAEQSRAEMQELPRDAGLGAPSSNDAKMREDLFLKE